MSIALAGEVARIAASNLPRVLGIIKNMRRRYGPLGFVSPALQRLGLKFPSLSPVDLSRLLAYGLAGEHAGVSIFNNVVTPSNSVALMPVNPFLFGSGGSGSRFLYRPVIQIAQPSLGLSDIISIPVESSTPLDLNTIITIGEDMADEEITKKPTVVGTSGEDLVSVITIGIDFAIRSF